MTETAHWWKKSVIYQIYPRSFCDSNGDGVGDIPGIISRLDYLKALGIDVIWLSPIFRSPQDDNGYDVSDYRDIDPLFGTLEDVRELFAQAKRRGIKIMLDMVLNHTSDEHPWFLEARQSRDNPKHDWYIWRDGVPGTPPTDMISTFGGSAWQWVPECGQYYLHQFSVKQPDLNWKNPEVRHALYDMINWWTEQGAGGYRFDAIESIAKIPEAGIVEEGPMLHEYVKELSAATLQGKNLVTVGEAWSANIERAKRWSNPDGSELSMVFQFQHIIQDEIPGGNKWDRRPLYLPELKKVIGAWQRGLRGCGWNSLFWENHDLPRIVSRWGNDKEYRETSAKMLATLLFGLQGTPYIYQGQELGMTNTDYPLSDYRDIELCNMAKERLAAGWPEKTVMELIHAKGRDNARTPMQWSDARNAGFTSGEPWLRVNPNYVQINVENEEKQPDSVLNYYKKLISLRRENDVFFDGDYTAISEEREDIFAYRRENGRSVLTVAANFTGRPVLIPELEYHTRGDLLICNYPTAEARDQLRPYEARMYLATTQTE